MEFKKPLVLIVDDNPTNIDLLVNTLQTEYRLGIAKNGHKALTYCDKHIPDLVLLDIMMPEIDGYEVCKRLKEKKETQNIVVVFITAITENTSKTKGFELGAVDYITKPFHAAEVKARVKNHLDLKQMREELSSQNEILEQKVEEKTLGMAKMLDSMIQSITLMVEIRDPYTAGHQERVSKLACALAKKMGLSETQIDSIRIAGLLHDIGKIRTPSSILNRPGKLLDAEFEIIKAHSQIGYDILKKIPTPLPLAKIVHQHHERLDGTGYPLGLKSDDILLESKIISVADVLEAMSFHRPYRPALGIDIALEEVNKNSGKYFDSDVVKVCTKELIIDILNT